MKRLIPFVLILFLYSCKNEKDFNKITEGIIEYEIHYSCDSASMVPVQFLPKTMVMRFNQNHASYRIEDMMGIFCITNITNLSRRTHISTIKIFDKKYKYEGKKGEVPVFFKQDALYAVEQLNDTVTVAGVACNKSIVTDIKERRKFEVDYSNEFVIKHPNINTPYSDIDGILMKFEIDLGKMRLGLTAKKIIPSSVNNSSFNVSDEYKEINQEKMRDIIATMLQ